MMRSLFSGVAGLRTHQTKMDVIGNNIANVNTTAYKSQSTTFRDLMYQTTQAASGANAITGVGGVNAKQIGLGVQVGAINTNIKGQGSAQNTGNAFDIMISGEAFFIVSNGLENFFTRDGSFYVDGAGNLAMTSTGYNVMGWQVDPETGDPKPDTVSPLKVMSPENMTYDPAATTDARVTGIIDKNDSSVNSTSGRIMNLEFYDNLGYLYTARFSIHATGEEGRYYVSLDNILDSGTGQPIEENILNVFGGTMTVNTSIAQKTLNPVTLLGNITYNSTDAAITPPAAPGIPINTDFPITADQLALFKVNGEVAVGDTVQVNEKGLLVANGGTYGLQDKVSVDELTVSDVTTGGLTFAAGTYTSVEDGTVTPGTATGANVGTADRDNILAAYGLDIVSAGVRSFTIEQDGSLTITSREVTNSANLNFDPTTGLFDSVAGSDSIMLNLNGVNEKFANININFSTSKNVNNGGSSTVGAAKGTSAGLGSGRKIGDMIGISIAKNGIITASYDNGMSKCLGQIATATFANASGLEKQGDNLYSATMNSGDFDGIGEDIETTGGYMQSGVLEMSNVDLSQEFTEMITTQRGFQANSRIITVSDSLLEELTNLKR